MKLLKKLIPIATVASAVTIVTPLITSCGGKQTFDGSKIYIPKTKQAVAEEGVIYDDSKATQLYFDDLDDHPNIFKEDMYYFISKNIYQTVHSEEILILDNVSYKMKISYSNIKVNVDEQRLSYKVSGSLFYNLPEVLSDVTFCDLDFTFNIENMQYDCEGQGTWKVKPVHELGSYENDEKCSCSMKMKGILVRPNFSLKLSNEKFEVNSETKPEDVEKNVEMSTDVWFFDHFLSKTDESFHLGQIPTTSI